MPMEVEMVGDGVMGCLQFSSQSVSLLQSLFSSGVITEQRN
jgi:hypothetical protein